MSLPLIVGCAIVRNEEKTLPRLFASCDGIVDKWIIVDTGSDDATMQLTAPVPIEWHERPWMNFGHNRTELMDLARGQGTWLLLVDADQEVTGEPLETLIDTGITTYLVEHTGSPSYWVPRLVRGDRPWRFVGPTHEYLDVADSLPYIRKKLDSLKIVHHADGGSRDNKLLRDRRLLRDYLREHKDDARSLFYLGRTELELDRPDRAIRHLLKRVELGGWDEETYYAQFEIGNALDRMHNTDKAITAWLGAWQLRPTRLEALHAAVRAMRILGLYQAAWSLSRGVIGQHEPDDILFVDHDVWHHSMFFEHSICSYYVEGPAACLQQSEFLLGMADVPDDIREYLMRNVETCEKDLK